MRLLAAVSVILLFPASLAAQELKVAAPPRLDSGRVQTFSIFPVHHGDYLLPTPDRAMRGQSRIVNDSSGANLTANVERGALLGAVIGGVLGVFASEHQPVAHGFTHTPAVLFIITYGGLGALLGVIAGTLLPGS